MSQTPITYSWPVRLLLVLAAVVMSACAPKCEQGTRIEVSARPADYRVDVFTPTQIQVRPGDTLVFRASPLDRWSVRFNGGATGPDGQNAGCECPVSEPFGAGFKGPLGALIGRIGPTGKPFLIGANRTITAETSGTLYLTSNDNLGPCDQRNRGSCYGDNWRSVTVCVSVITNQ